MTVELLGALRTATAAAHRAFEASPCMARLVAPDATLEDIGRALAVLGAGFGAVESRISTRALTWYRAQAPVFDADRARLGAHRLDLANLGVEPPALTADGATLGAAYVLVGSRLGSRSIAARLTERFGAAWVADTGAYGAEQDYTASQWASLRGALSAAAERDTADVVAAAQATFAFLHAVAERAGPVGPGAGNITA